MNEMKTHIVQGLCGIALLAVASSGCGQRSGSFEWETNSGNARKSEEQPSRALEPAAVIQSPGPGDLITDDITQLRGHILGLPSEHTLHVFAVNRYGWFLQWPPPYVDPETGLFSAKNIRLEGENEEEWELHVVRATSEANQFLDTRARTDNWGSLPYLPKGCKSISLVRVRRADSVLTE
jgi:hypothetical protein